MNGSPRAEEVWRQFHWAFFVNTQGLMIALKRFEEAFSDGDEVSASLELRAATDLLRSAASSMELAGAFTRDEYEHEVRPSMSQPNVALDNFSGLMSWDHTAMIRLWRRMQPSFRQAQTTLPEEYEGFLSAYRQLASSHRAVCAKFGGDEAGSIRHKDEVAVDILDRFFKNRRGIIGCPMHP